MDTGALAEKDGSVDLRPPSTSSTSSIIRDPVEMGGSSDKVEKDRDPVEMSGSGGPGVERRAKEESKDSNIRDPVEMVGSSDKAEKDRDPVEKSGSGRPVVERRARELSEKEKFWEVLMRGTSNVPLPKGKVSGQVEKVGVQQSGQVEKLGVQQSGQVEKVGVQQSGQVEKLGVQQSGQVEKVGVQQSGQVEKYGVQQSGKVEKWTIERMEERRMINARLRDGGTAHKVRVGSPPGTDTRGARSGGPHPSSLCTHLIGLDDCRLGDIVKGGQGNLYHFVWGRGKVCHNPKTCRHSLLPV